MKFSELFEREWYRGEGKGSAKTSAIVWWSEEEKLAKGYSEQRGGDTIVKRKSFEPKSPINFGSDKLVLDSSNFVAHVMTEMRKRKLPLDKETQLPAVRNFKGSFGNSKIKIIDFWKDEASKGKTATFLKIMGFDSIIIKEDGVTTIGVLS